MAQKANRNKKNTPAREEATVQVAKITQTGVVIGLVITAIVAPIALLIANKIIDTTQTATPSTYGTGTLTLPPVEGDTPTMETIPVDDPTATSVAAPSLVMTETPTLTPIPLTGVMIAQIKANYLEGKAPLRATFRAGSSYLSFPDGSTETCEYANVCSYTWDVREKNGATIHGPELGGSEFSYEFSRRGEFIVVVYVCRGQACSFTSVSITTR